VKLLLALRDFRSRSLLHFIDNFIDLLLKLFGILPYILKGMLGIGGLLFQLAS